MKSLKALIIGAALALAGGLTAATLAPPAHAHMQMGNYQVLTPRDPVHVWIWQIGCDSSCIHVNALPVPPGGAVPWDGYAQLVNGRYTMAVDVFAGKYCPGYALSTHDVYNWDAVTLEGSVDSSYDVGCFGGPGGTDSYPFTLARY